MGVFTFGLVLIKVKMLINFILNVFLTVPVTKCFVRNSTEPDSNDCGTGFEGTDYSKETLEQNQKLAVPAVIPAGENLGIFFKKSTNTFLF